MEAQQANQDLWELLDAEIAARRVRFEWVRGHDVDAINNRADELALMGANGRLVADGALPRKQAQSSKGDDSTSGSRAASACSSRANRFANAQDAARSS